MNNNKLVQLNKNENLYGPSPKCYNVVRDITVDDFIYYSRDSVGAIQKQISQQFNLPADQIILGYGAEDIIKTLFTHYVQAGDKVLIPDKSWWYYTSLVEQRDAEPVIYPLEERDTEFITNVDTLLQYEKEISPKMILVCSPNNPTGNSVDINDFERLLKANRDRIICLDETYWGYASQDTTDTLMGYLAKYDNLIVIRSFSKYYALAGVRIGYAFCGQKVKKHLKFYDKILGFNRISEKLVVTALQSEGYYKEITQDIVEDRERIYREINEIPGLTAYKSDANFLLLKIQEDLKQPLDKQLRAKGLQIKFFTEKAFPNYARFSLGTQEHNQIVLETIKEKVLSKSTV